jgi:predicted Fe-S protein YdhL (DUF1289 family)
MPQDSTSPDRAVAPTSTHDMDVTELRRMAPGVNAPGVGAQGVSASGTGQTSGPATPAEPPSASHHDASHSLSPTDSPCVAVCSTLYDDVCRGCGRTAMEVANWVFLDDEEKREVWQRIKSQGYPRRKG